MVRKNQVNEPSVIDAPSLSSRMNKIGMLVKFDRYDKFLQHVISFQTAGPLINKLPQQMANDDTIYNAVIRSHHKNLWHDDWNENLTDMVKEFFNIMHEAILIAQQTK